jgi:hypothetical protein
MLGWQRTGKSGRPAQLIRLKPAKGNHLFDCVAAMSWK